MTISGSCHCGAVRLSVPGRPGWLGCCDCSLCRRTGWLVAFYPDDGSVRVEGRTVPYVWGDRMIRIHHCPTCGVGTHWDSTGESHGKVGINGRLLDGFEVREGQFAIGGEPLELRFIHNAD